MQNEEIYSSSLLTPRLDALQCPEALHQRVHIYKGLSLPLSWMYYNVMKLFIRRSRSIEGFPVFADFCSHFHCLLVVVHPIHVARDPINGDTLGEYGMRV